MKKAKCAIHSKSCIKQSQLFNLTQHIWTITYLELIAFEPTPDPSWTVTCERPWASTKRRAWLFPFSCYICSYCSSCTFGMKSLDISMQLVLLYCQWKPAYLSYLNSFRSSSGERQKLWKISCHWVHVAKTMDISASYLVQSHRPQNFGGAESECGLTNTRNFAQPPQKQTGSAHPKLTLSQGKEETTILPWRHMDTEQSELKKTSSAKTERFLIWFQIISGHSHRSAYFCMLSSPGEPSSFCDLACSALICKLQHTGAKLLVNLVNASETLLGVMPEPYTLTGLNFRCLCLTFHHEEQVAFSCLKVDFHCVKCRKCGEQIQTATCWPPWQAAKRTVMLISLR